MLPKKQKISFSTASVAQLEQKINQNGIQCHDDNSNIYSLNILKGNSKIKKNEFCSTE